MTWKEKIRICIDVLFKGRDIKEELNADSYLFFPCHGYSSLIM